MRVFVFAEYQLPLADPPDASVIGPAQAWFQNILMGSIGTIIAGLAIASIGFAMFSGRVDIRRGLAVVLGFFVLVGAPYIAKGLLGAVVSEGLTTVAVPPPPIYAKPQPGATSPPDGGYDPYAGAAVQR